MNSPSVSVIFEPSPQQSCAADAVPSAFLVQKGKIAMQQYLRTPESANYLGIGQSTLAKLRVAGGGPKFRRLGKRTVVYSTDDLDAWTAEQTHFSTSEAA
tara:strand:+ start:30129 stop:30428 length:300 start_codon:yes stop_codon:yes gene_type:complete